MHGTREYNFDGLVGPSHNYAGLSFGNVASFSNVKSASNIVDDRGWSVKHGACCPWER